MIEQEISEKEGEEMQEKSELEGAEGIKLPGGGADLTQRQVLRSIFFRLQSVFELQRLIF